MRVPLDERTAYALRERADSFRQFSRNARWGTCVGCPLDTAGHAYPEFCEYTEHYDHQLTAASLAENFEHYRRLGP